MRFDESGFDTPADNGLGDESVLNFVQLRDDPDGEINLETDSQMELADNISATATNKVQYDTIEGDASVL